MSGTMYYSTLPPIILLHTVLMHSLLCNGEFLILQEINFVTHTNHVCDYITTNYNSMTHRVGIYNGRVSLYRNLTRITVSDSKTGCISHHVPRNSINNSETRLPGTMNYDTSRRTKLLHTVLLLSIHCKDDFSILQYINFVHY